MNIDRLWENLIDHQGDVFYTITHLPFKYRIEGNRIFTDRSVRPISRDEFILSYLSLPIDGPSDINQITRGASYVWALLNDERIVELEVIREGFIKENTLFNEWSKYNIDDLYNVDRNKIIWHNVDRSQRREVYKTFSNEHYDDFEHNFSFELTNIINSGYTRRHIITLWQLSINDENYVQIYVNQSLYGENSYSLIFHQRVSGNNIWVYRGNYKYELNKTYYLSIKKETELFELNVYEDQGHFRLIESSGLQYGNNIRYNKISIAKAINVDVDKYDASSGRISNLVTSAKKILNVLLISKDDLIQNLLYNNIKSTGLLPTIFEYEYGSIIYTLSSYLSKMDLYIIDVSSKNINIIFLLGYLYAKNKKIIIIQDSYVDINLPKENLIKILYNEGDYDDLLEQLDHYIKDQSIKGRNNY